MFIMVLLIVQSVAIPTFAEDNADEQDVTKKVIETSLDIPLYEESDESSNLLISLNSNDEVTIIEEFDTFSFVEYINENEEKWQGYIENKYLIHVTDENVVAKAEEEKQQEAGQKASEDEKQLSLASAGKLYDGIALNKLNVYENQSTKSNVVKSYPAGANLKYRALNDNWYEATVFIKGKRTKGFIRHKDVENKFESQKSVQGIALKSTTNVYATATTSAKKLRSYTPGTILKYRTFTDSWYEATVILKGKRTIGYIPKADVENAVSEQESVRGISLKSPTKVYAKATTSAKQLRSYPAGTVLMYRTFTKNWYEATVILKGKRTVGYIAKADVETADSEHKLVEGVAIKDPTPVYAKPSTNSKVLRNYTYSTMLKYRTFTSKWYEATIYLNGKKTTSYIRKADVDAMTHRFEGFAHKNPTKMYSEPSTTSPVLKEYKRGSKLIYRAYNEDWWTSSVSVNGKFKPIYIHKNDVSFEMRDLLYKTKYNYDYKAMADRQAKKKPNADGGGKINATRGEIEFYSNPMNFPSNTDEHFQFLVLSQPAGISAKQINNNILNDNAGVLKGQAKAFIDAGKQLQINEIYLIAHALHETGNGKSILASGIPVDKAGKVTRDSKGKMTETSKTVATVYNMFGNGALTSCPIDCGAKYAYDKKWFSVKDAIVGGIEDISKYIDRGQDTLYKMRWNPIGGTPNPPFAEWNQYATHIQWATITTKRIAQMYNLLEDYTLEMDVPTFNNMPDYKKGAPAITTPASLKLRSGAASTSSEIGSIPKGSEVLIVGSNVNASYKIKYNGKTGWVSAKHVKLKY